MKIDIKENVAFIIKAFLVAIQDPDCSTKKSPF
jgi:hypothetical protein